MTGLDYFAWVVLIVLILTVLIGFFVLARLPGQIAKSRNHPQAEAITVAGWLGALMFGVFWPLALIWAFTVPATRAQSEG
jgi:Kef-type K+ transport system membrane component KefB